MPERLSARRRRRRRRFQPAPFAPRNDAQPNSTLLRPPNPHPPPTPTGHHHAGETVTYAGLALPKRSGLQYAVGKTVGAACWFWVFVMLYNEWDHKTKGLPAIFEAEGLDDDGGDHHH